MLWIDILLYEIICLFFVCCLHLKMLVHGKCKYNHKTLPRKCQALKDLDKGLSNKDVVAKFGKGTW